MDKKKIVVALGHTALGATLPEQKQAVKNAAKSVADLIEAGYDVVISHSNAPQVGMIHTALNEFGKSHPDYTFAPMSVCSAMSQGYIGYDLQNSLREELLMRGIFKTVSTILTQVIVDPYDEAFYEPIKIIGRRLTRSEAAAEEKKGNSVIEESEGVYRRIVAAPKPVEIVEIDAIRTLMEAGQPVIAAGGGGIPVIQQDNHLKGASAVIEKDYTCALLADKLNADHLLILTGVEKACLHYNTTQEQPLDKITPAEAASYIKDGHFAPETMLPKIEAGQNFVTSGKNRTAIITSLNKAIPAMQGKTGTHIVLEA